MAWVCEGNGIGEYGLIADGHTAALVHRRGTIDWCCLKRLDAGSVFARLLDAERGGHFALAPSAPRAECERDYLDGTLVLSTTWQTADGSARVLDFLAVDADDPAVARRQLVRVVEGLSGEVEFEAHVAPRFDYGAATPWLVDAPDGTHYASAGDDALVVSCGTPATRRGAHELGARFTVAAGKRVRLELRDVPPCALDADPSPRPSPPDVLDARLEETIAWWGMVAARGAAQDRSRRHHALGDRAPGPDQPAHRRCRRRSHHIAARVAGWTHLGLPVLMGAGLDLQRPLAGRARLRGGSRRVPALHPALLGGPRR
jgi:hypothetical protein